MKKWLNNNNNNFKKSEYTICTSFTVIIYKFFLQDKINSGRTKTK